MNLTQSPPVHPSQQNLLWIALGIAALPGCYGPSQDFAVGTSEWLRSNPEFQISENPKFQTPKRITVAVLDGGMDYNHPRLRGHLIPFPASVETTGRSYGIGFDLLGGEHDFFPHYSVLDANSGEDLSDLMSIREHATHVAGLATLGNPEIGILPVRVIPIPENRVENLTPDAMIFAGEEVKTRFSQDAISHVGKGVRLACSHGARVVNLSLGIDFSGLSSESQQKVVATLESGILNSIRNDCANSLLVVAAGNESREVKEVSYSIPVTLEEPNIIGVGALKSQAQSLSAFYSNQGRYVDIFMRGSDVRSSVPVTEEHADLYASLSGTSMATPLISHLAARILLILPQLSPQELRALILNTAELKELTLEAAPEPQDGEDSVPVSLPARRLGLVASFGNALKAAKSIRDASDLVRNELQQKLLKAPFEHGHSPF